MGVLVAGMHRSGTSVLSRFCGLLIGYQGYSGAAFDNVEGHWEDPRLNRALDQVMWSLDADWASPPLAPVDLAAPELGAHAPKVVELVARLGSEPWVVKDPRLCLVLGSLLAAVPGEHAVIATFRDPLDVARSVHTRDGYQPEYGLALWEVYTRQLALQGAATAGPVVWVSYEGLLADPTGTAARLQGPLEAVGIPVLADRIARARESVRHDLRHHSGADDGLRLSHEQSELLALVRLAASGAGTPSVADLPPLTPWARALIETRRPYAHMERRNKLLMQRLRRVRPLFRAADWARRALGRPTPADPFGDPA